MLSYLRFSTKYFLLPIMLVALGAIVSALYLINAGKTLSADGNWYDTPNGIDRAEYVSIGGIDQYIRIRSRDRNNPVLLDLHGGPGSSQSSLTHRLLRPLTEYFTLVEWDQRGAGRSEGGISDVDAMSYDRMVDDTVEVIEFLRTDIGSAKVVLVGHSWGSMLGLGVVQERPDLIHAYVGVGQALAWPGGFDETLRLLKDAALRDGDDETLGYLNALSEEWPPAAEIDAFLERVNAIQVPLQSYGKSLHASKSQDVFSSNFALDIVISPDVGVVDALGSLSISEASKTLMIDLYGRDLRADLGTTFEVPIFIFQGAHDWQAPTSMVRPWFEMIEAPQKEYIPFEDSGHFIINEEPGKFLVELVTKVRPIALASTSEGDTLHSLRDFEEQTD